MNTPVWSDETLETKRKQSGKPYLEVVIVVFAPAEFGFVGKAA